jgi:hypothetical protein
MRRSSIVSTLFSAVFSAGMLGGVAAGNSTGVAAEFTATSTSMQAIRILQNASEWANSDSNAFLIPAPYRIAASQAVDYAATLRGEMIGSSYAWKSLFSPRMLALLSSRWDDASASLPGLIGQSGDVDPEDMEMTDEASARTDDAAQSDGQSSALYDWLLGDWTLPDFANPGYWNVDGIFGAANSNNGTAAPRGKIDAGATGSTPPNSSPPSDESANRRGGDALDRFVLDEDCAFRYSPEYNGSFGYPCHLRTQWLLSHATAPADGLATSRETGPSGYREEQYSIKYGDEVTTVDDSTANNPATSAVDNADENAAAPQSNPDAATTNPTNLHREFAEYLRCYLGIEATIDPLTPINAWNETAPANFDAPMNVRTTTTILDPCTAMWHENIASYLWIGQEEPSLGDGSVESQQNDVNGEAPVNTDSNDGTASAGRRPNTPVRHFGLLLQDEVNRWADAFHHTLAQFSLVRGVF